MKFSEFLLILAVLFLSALGIAAQTTAVPAQQKRITKKDFEKVDKKAKQLLKTMSYRVTKTSEHFSNNEKQPSFIGKAIEEYVPPDRSHMLFDHTIDGKFWRTELIKVGGRKFEKKNAGSWKKTSESDAPIGAIDSVLSAEYLADGSTLLDGKNADVFLVVRKIKSSVGTINAIQMACLDKKTYWYDNDGRVLKVLLDIQCEDSKSHGTDIYEYDPNIKIEAPIK